MKSSKLSALLGFIVLAIYALLQIGPSDSGTNGPNRGGSFPTANRAAGHAVPQKAVETLHYVREHGNPPPGYVGGRVFQNREGRLPRNGSYREYDVDPKEAGQSRNADRLIIDDATGRAWYTGDHYTTFIEFQ